MTHYVAILAPWQTGKWRVLIPDAPDCDTTGNSPSGTVREAILKVTRRVSSNSVVPTAPRDLLAIATDPAWMSRSDIDFSNAVVTLIPWRAIVQSELYHTRAADCLRLANCTDDAQHRSMYLNMTECWNALEARASLAENGTRLDPAERDI